MAKKWGILIKKESESLIFTGLKIPRDYIFGKEEEFVIDLSCIRQIGADVILVEINVEKARKKC